MPSQRQTEPSLFQRLQNLIQGQIISLKEDLEMLEKLVGNHEYLDIETTKSEIEISEMVLSELKLPCMKACQQIELDIINQESTIASVLLKKEVIWANFKAIHGKKKKYILPRNSTQPWRVNCPGLQQVLAEVLLWSLIDNAGMVTFEEYLSHLRRQNISNLDAISPIFPPGEDITSRNRQPGEIKLYRVVKLISRELSNLVLCRNFRRSNLFDQDGESEGSVTGFKVACRERITDLKSRGKKPQFWLDFFRWVDAVANRKENVFEASGLKKDATSLGYMTEKGERDTFESAYINNKDGFSKWFIRQLETGKKPPQIKSTALKPAPVHRSKRK